MAARKLKEAEPTKGAELPLSGMVEITLLKTGTKHEVTVELARTLINKKAATL